MPEWGGTVRIATLSIRDRNTMFQGMFDAKTGQAIPSALAELPAKMCAYCIIDEDGNRIFTEQDIDQLAKKCASAIDRIAKAAEELNGVAPDSVKVSEKN